MLFGGLAPDAIHDRLCCAQAGLITSNPVVHQSDNKTQGALSIRLGRIEGDLARLPQDVGFASSAFALAPAIRSRSTASHNGASFADNLLKAALINRQNALTQKAQASQLELSTYNC